MKQSGLGLRVLAILNGGAVVGLAMATSSITLSSAALAEGEAVDEQRVAILVGLDALERDMMLGMLLAQSGVAMADIAHFIDAQQDTWPLLKDGLAGIGVEDYGNLVDATTTAADAAAATAAAGDVNTATILAEAALHATDKEQITAILQGVSDAHVFLSKASPNAVEDYQDGWAGLMVMRGKLDLLMQSADPAIKKAAGDMANDMDNVILSMPDPVSVEPIEFAPDAVAELLADLQALVGTL